MNTLEKQYTFYVMTKMTNVRVSFKYIRFCRTTKQNYMEYQEIYQ